MPATVNVEFSTGHVERYTFSSGDAAISFLWAIASDMKGRFPDEEVYQWCSPRRLAFWEPGCVSSYATLHDDGESLSPIDMPSGDFAEMASRFGGKPATGSAPAPTRADVERLKRNWLGDPGCYDLECVEGFEPYYDELLEFRRSMEATWAAKRLERLEAKAEALGCPGNVKLAEYVERLEERLDRLENEGR